MLNPRRTSQQQPKQLPLPSRKNLNKRSVTPNVAKNNIRKQESGSDNNVRKKIQPNAFTTFKTELLQMLKSQ